MTPDGAELARLDLPGLVDRVARLEPTAETGPGGNWLLLEERFRAQLLDQWDLLDASGWALCAEAFDRLSTWLEQYGGLPHWGVVHRRFHLFSELLVEAGPRPEFPLTDPARLLRAFLDGFPYPPGDAEARLGTGLPELHLPMLPMSLMRRVEHLFPPGPDLDTYRAWQEVLARSSGIPESERTPRPRGVDTGTPDAGTAGPPRTPPGPDRDGAEEQETP